MRRPRTAALLVVTLCALFSLPPRCAAAQAAAFVPVQAPSAAAAAPTAATSAVPLVAVPRAAPAPAPAAPAPATVEAVPTRVPAAAQPSAPLKVGCGEAGCSIQPSALPDPDDDRRTLDAAVALLLIAPIYVLICAAVNRCVLSQHLQIAEAAQKDHHDGAGVVTPLLPSSQAASGRRLGYVCGGRVPLFVACYVFEAVVFALIAPAVVSASNAAPGAAAGPAAAVAVAASPRASPLPPAPLSPPVLGVPAAVVQAAGAPAPAVAAAAGPAGAPLAARSAPAMPSLGNAGSSDGGAGGGMQLQLPTTTQAALPSLRRAGPHGTPPPPAPWLDDHMFG